MAVNISRHRVHHAEKDLSAGPFAGLLFMTSVVIEYSSFETRLQRSSATVFAVKADRPVFMLSAAAGRVKAGAFAPLLAQLSALSRPSSADLVPPGNRWHSRSVAKRVAMV